MPITQLLPTLISLRPMISNGVGGALNATVSFARGSFPVVAWDVIPQLLCASNDTSNSTQAYRRKLIQATGILFMLYHYDLPFASPVRTMVTATVRGFPLATLILGLFKVVAGGALAYGCVEHSHEDVPWIAGLSLAEVVSAAAERSTNPYQALIRAGAAVTSALLYYRNHRFTSLLDGSTSSQPARSQYEDLKGIASVAAIVWGASLFVNASKA